ncbi:MAG: glycogen synthase GlgA [Melioribacteraceae bacterium]
MPAGKKLKILFVTSEVVPFIKTGGLADVSSALPQILQELGHQVRIVVPKYGAIDERKYKIHEVVRLKDLTTEIDKKEVVFSLRSSFLIGQKTRVQIYFLDNNDYYGSRHSLYSDPMTGEEYADNDERFILLARSIFDLIQKLGWIPDIIHCNDWQCGLIPVYLKTMYNDDPMFENIKTVFTVHNLASQGVFPKSSFAKTGLPNNLEKESGVLQKGKMNFLKSGLLFADAINTVSETYAKEISEDKTLGLGLYDSLSKRKKDLYGIINGIDDSIWNPEIDSKIPKKYSMKNLDHKIENKKALADNFNLEYKREVPIIGLISRLVDNKGFDLLKKAVPDLLKIDAQFVILGTGDKKYHKFLESLSSKNPNKFSCYLGFDDELAHLIEAGSDMFLMPSLYEPCGLNQMYSLMYGTVPIVRKTGGLADTVIPYNSKNEEGNGFVFEKYNAKEMVAEIKNAVKVYSSDQKTWQKIMKNGMKSNFTWLNSAKNYIDLYRKLTD